MRSSPSSRSLLFAFALLTGMYGFAQNFDGFNYQAVIRNTAGDPLPNQAIGVRFSIWGDAQGPHLETYAVTTDALGMIKLTMGEGTLQDGPAFSEIDWSADNSSWSYCVDVDLTGGTNYQLLGCESFKAVPFAMRALRSDAGPPSGWSLVGTTLSNTNTGYVGIGTTNPTAKLEVSTPGIGFRQTNGNVSADLGIFGTDVHFGAFSASHNLILTAGGTTRMILRGDNGRVGIGRNPTQQQLEVEGGAHFTNNVGIGTATPASKLDVEGGISVGATYSGATAAPANGAIIEGNVGIGTTSATDKLTVRTTTANFGFTHTDGTITVGSYVGGVAGGGWYGTKSNHNLNFFTNNNTAQMTLATSGNVGIGTTTPQSKLSVNGKITCKEVEVTLTGFPDYVFEQDYRLMPLVEVEAYIAANGHLPNVPSACEVEENGLGLGEMNKILLEKVEELTLHAIAKEKEAAVMAERIARLEAIVGGSK